MKTWDRLSSAVFLLAALGWSYESSKLPLGQFSLPGPGFQPLWAAAVLGLLSLVLFIEASLRRPEGGEALSAGWSGSGKVLAMMAALVGYALVLNTVGYLLATGLLLAVFLLLERQRWPIVLGVALVSAVVSYWLFAVWLQVPLPRGLLGL